MGQSRVPGYGRITNDAAGGGDPATPTFDAVVETTGSAAGDADALAAAASGATQTAPKTICVVGTSANPRFLLGGDGSAPLLGALDYCSVVFNCPVAQAGTWSATAPALRGTGLYLTFRQPIQWSSGTSGPIIGACRWTRGGFFDSTWHGHAGNPVVAYLNAAIGEAADVEFGFPTQGNGAAKCDVVVGGGGATTLGCDTLVIHGAPRDVTVGRADFTTGNPNYLSKLVLGWNARNVVIDTSVAIVFQCNHVITGTLGVQCGGYPSVLDCGIVQGVTTLKAACNGATMRADWQGGVTFEGDTQFTNVVQQMNTTLSGAGTSLLNMGQYLSVARPGRVIRRIEQADFTGVNATTKTISLGTLAKAAQISRANLFAGTSMTGSGLVSITAQVGVSGDEDAIIAITGDIKGGGTIATAAGATPLSNTADRAMILTLTSVGANFSAITITGAPFLALDVN